MQRRRRRAQVEAREGVLRLRELSEVRFHAVEQADPRTVPELRTAASRTYEAEGGKPSTDLAMEMTSGEALPLEKTNSTPANPAVEIAKT